MPIIRSAIKKVRKDKKRTIRNLRRKNSLKELIKKVRREADPKNLQAAFSALDKAAKVSLIHPNKASRLKSRLSKLLSNEVAQTPKNPTKRSSAKKPSQKKRR